MKIPCFLPSLLLLPLAVRAEENKHDVLAHALMPFVSLLTKESKTGQRAVQLTVRIEAMTGLPRELLGTRAEIALQAPDMVRISGPLLGENLTVCRHGRELWITPGSRAETALATAAAAGKLPPEDRSYRLSPFELPIPEKNLVFLPALFRVEDLGRETLDGESCRVLDLALMPELEQGLKTERWRARLWARASGSPARLIVQRPGWQIAIRIERVEFAKSLPAATWQPAAEDAADVLKLTPSRYRQILDSLSGNSPAAPPGAR